MRTENENKALREALRMLGNPKGYPWKRRSLLASRAIHACNRLSGGY